MPNHVDHDCTILGPERDVQDLCEFYLDDRGAPEADALIPYPEEFRIADDLVEQWRENGRVGPPPKDGYNQGGYEWCVENWGSKWGPYNGRGVTANPIKRKGQRKVTLRFFTAWAPAIPVYAALAQRFPRCTLRVWYYEAGSGFKGKLIYKNGNCLLDWQGDYRGRRGG